MAKSSLCKWLLIFFVSSLAACSAESGSNEGLLECTSVIDCGENGLCLEDPSGASTTGKICFEKECNVDTDCNDGLCVDFFCVDNNGGGCTSDSQCAEGQSCDIVTGKCMETVPPAPEGACAPCEEGSNDGCAAELVCAQVGPGWNCVSPCTNNSQCASGWICGAGGTGPNCVPGIYKCSDCLLNGCTEAGTVCYADTGSCGPVVKTCGICTKNGQCGPGKRCLGKGGTKYCVPECSSNQCAKNGTCKANSEGIKVCEWDNAEGPCCLGDNCGGSTIPNPCDDIECAGTVAPYCVGGKCVECTQNNHCQNGNCKPDNVCSENNTPQCKGSTPIWNAELGQCCQCSSSTHCGGSPCDGCSCKTGTGNEVCDACTAPYPGCAQYDGQWVCVQCSEDVHCSTGGCDTQTWTCSGGGGPPTTGNCQTKGCSNPAHECDQQSGLCFNPSGNCDDVTEFCPNGGKCVGELESMFACLGGGGGGGIPSIPGAPTGAPNSGTCECHLGAGETPGISQGDCSSGLTCGPDPFAGILALFAALQGQTCEPPNTCQSP